MFAPTQGGQLLLEATGKNRSTLRVNQNSVFAKFLRGFDGFVAEHAAALMDGGLEARSLRDYLVGWRVEMDEQGGEVFLAVDHTSSQPLSVDGLFTVLSLCALFKQLEDAARITQAIESDGKVLATHQAAAEDAVRSDWTGVRERVAEKAREHAARITDAERARDSQVALIDDKIKATKSRLLDKAEERARLIRQLASADSATDAEESANVGMARRGAAVSISVDQLRHDIARTDREMVDIRLSMDALKQAREGELMEQETLRSTQHQERDRLAVELTELGQVVGDKSRVQASLRDARAQAAKDAAWSAEHAAEAASRSATLSAELGSVKEAIATLATPDPTAAAQERARVESSLSSFKYDTATVHKRTDARTARVVSNQSRVDDLQVRIKHLRAELQRLTDLNSSTLDVERELKALVEENDSIRSQLRNMTLDPAAYVSAMRLKCPRG
jgi:chromosome segregation ATPase